VGWRGRAWGLGMALKGKPRACGRQSSQSPGDGRIGATQPGSRLAVGTALAMNGRVLPCLHNNSNGVHMISTILLVILILLLIGALPTWPHSREWGYVPSGGLGLVVVILLVLLLLGYV